jgi:hypothetical protein
MSAPLSSLAESVVGWFHDRVDAYNEDRKQPTDIYRAWGEESSPGFADGDTAAAKVIIEDAVNLAMEHVRNK